MRPILITGATGFLGWHIARLLADEAERKAKRDARYAARKARAGRH